MSETDPKDEFPSSPEHTYFHAVEDVFLRLRGAPLQLTPVDFEITEEWYRQGIPLDVVERALDDFFTSRKERGIKRRVSNLRICRPAVERAWEGVRDLAAGGPPRDRPRLPPLDVEARLRSLVRHLPAELPQRGRLIRRLEALQGDADGVEARLAVLDGEMVDSSKGGVDPETLKDLERQVDEALETLARRLPEAEIQRARQRLLVQKLRERLRLPVLSLFSPEAQVEDDEEKEGGEDDGEVLNPPAETPEPGRESR